MTTTKRITDYLVLDHERLHVWLTRASRPAGFDAAAFAQFRAGLLRHIAIEEKILFPAVRRARGGMPIEGAKELRIEHAALTSLLVPTPDAALCGELLSLLSPHDAKEEGPSGVYAACERLLSDVESAALAERAVSYPEVPVAPHFDGPGVYRTAELALAAARRIRETKDTTEPSKEPVA